MLRLTYIETFELCDNKFYYTEWILPKERKKCSWRKMFQKRFNGGKGDGIFIEIFSLGIAFGVVTGKVNEAKKSMKVSTNIGE